MFIYIILNPMNTHARNESPVRIRLELLRQGLREANAVEEPFESLRLNRSRRAQSMLAKPFELFVVQQRVGERPAEAARACGRHGQRFGRRVPQLGLAPLDEPLANQIDEDVQNRMPLVSLDVKEAHVRCVRRIIQFQASAVRRVVEAREKDQRAHERLTDAR